MFLALKGNREFKIQEEEKDSFLALGFDIYKSDKAGKAILVEKSEKDSDKVKKVLVENEKLKAEIDALKSKQKEEDK